MTKEPLFLSIVVPTRNRKQLVLECLRCIQNQTDSDFEVILSDNGTDATCEAQFQKFSDDNRFANYRPPRPMNMCDHWDFATKKARGEYVTILAEKFMLRPDAVQILKTIAQKHDADVMSWQYDFFEISSDTAGEELRGSYRPLVKPGLPVEYSAEQELARRFSFEKPMYCRAERNREGFGKIYGGCIRHSLLKKIRKNTGRLFHSYSPDFTSMPLILNDAHRCIDVRQSLMNVVYGENVSNGFATRQSVSSIESYITSYDGSIAKYADSSIVKNFWLGHNVSIASDYNRVKSFVTEGPLTRLTVDKLNLYGWLYRDISSVEDWSGYSRSYFESILEKEISALLPNEKAYVTDRLSQDFIDSPSENEIYHCGWEKAAECIPNLSPRELAQLYWEQKIALPRKNGQGATMTISDAVDDMYKYNEESSRILSRRNAHY